MAWVTVPGSNSLWQYENSATAANTYPDSADGANSTVSGGVRTHTRPGTNAVTKVYMRTRKTGEINLVNYSEEFDNAYWSKAAVTVSANAGVAPDGTTTADKVIPNSSGGSAGNLGPFRSITSDNKTYSIFAKADGFNFISLIHQAGATNSKAGQFNLATGVVTTTQNATAAIKDVGNGWYRCSVFSNTAVSAGTLVTQANDGSTPDTSNHFRCTISGDGSKGVLMWGAQLNEGTILTPYIKTTNAASSTIERGELSKTYYDGQ